MIKHVQLNDQHEILPENENLDRKEWMILSDLMTPFETHIPTHDNYGYDWYINCCNYTDQQIGGMPSWLSKVSPFRTGPLTFMEHNS